MVRAGDPMFDTGPVKSSPGRGLRAITICLRDLAVVASRGPRERKGIYYRQATAATVRYCLARRKRGQGPCRGQGTLRGPPSSRLTPRVVRLPDQDGLGLLRGARFRRGLRVHCAHVFVPFRIGFLLHRALVAAKGAARQRGSVALGAHNGSRFVPASSSLFCSRPIPCTKTTAGYTELVPANPEQTPSQASKASKQAKQKVSFAHGHNKNKKRSNKQHPSGKTEASSISFLTTAKHVTGNHAQCTRG